MVSQTITHIRIDPTWDRYCGLKEGGSVSQFHYENKPAHITSLNICLNCKEKYEHTKNK